MAVPRLVALLRGINVGGKNIVPMSELRTVFEELGHTDVSTFIQSGNVVFSTRQRVQSQSLEAAIASRFAVRVTVALRTSAELRVVVDGNPFTEADRSRLHVGFLTHQPSARAVSDLDADIFSPEQFAVRGREIYLHLPDGMGRSKLPAYLDRRLQVPMTIRNWNTVTRLVELARS